MFSYSNLIMERNHRMEIKQPGSDVVKAYFKISFHWFAETLQRCIPACGYTITFGIFG